MMSLVWLGQTKFLLNKLKKKSYVIWRKRVRGRLSKHRKRSRMKLNNYEF